MLLIPIVWYILFLYTPIYGILIAFKDYRPAKGIWGSEWVGFKHFLRFFAFPDFWPYIRNTFLISFYGICTFPCAVIFALMLNELRNEKFKKTVQMITYAPHFISTVVMCGMIILFLSPSSGVIPKLCALVGIQTGDLMGKAEEAADGGEALLSITHEGLMAAAVCIWQK